MAIKLTQFDELKTAVKKFGIKDFSSIIEIIEFETKGLNIEDLSNVLSSNNGELFVILKDGSIRKTIIHIVDISPWPETWGYPRFHIYSCDKIKEMYKKGKKQRYKASSRKDGSFLLVKKNKEWEQSLDICSFCLTLYNKQFKIRKTKQSFLVKEYIEAPINHLEFSGVPEDYCTIPNDYTKSWSKISSIVKEQANYICSKCWNDFSEPVCKRFLHTHHIDGDKKNNIQGNLKALCIDCHSKEPDHAHIRKTPQYKEFLNSSCPKP